MTTLRDITIIQNKKRIVYVEASRFDSPQRLERRALRCGDASDAADLHPIVGSWRMKRIHTSACLYIPKPNGAIVAATGKQFAICTKRHTFDHLGMPLQAMQLCPTLNIP